MIEIDHKEILKYIQERVIADDDTTWKHIKIRFGTDKTILEDGKLYRPANYIKKLNETNRS